MLYCVMQWSIFAFMYFVFLSFALFHATYQIRDKIGSKLSEFFYLRYTDYSSAEV